MGYRAVQVSHGSAKESLGRTTLLQYTTKGGIRIFKRCALLRVVLGFLCTRRALLRVVLGFLFTCRARRASLTKGGVRILLQTTHAAKGGVRILLL